MVKEIDFLLANASSEPRAHPDKLSVQCRRTQMRKKFTWSRGSRGHSRPEQVKLWSFYLVLLTQRPEARTRSFLQKCVCVRARVFTSGSRTGKQITISETTSLLTEGA